MNTTDHIDESTPLADNSAPERTSCGQSEALLYIAPTEETAEEWAARIRPDNLEGPPRTPEEMAADRRELERVAPTPGDKFRLMFGGGQTGIVSQLRHYNRWRRGEHDDMPLPSDIGKTLDAAADRIEQLEQVIRAATVLIAAKGRHNTMLAYEGLRTSLATVKETP